MSCQSALNSFQVTASTSFHLVRLLFGCFCRCLKRKDSLPVSRMSQ